MILHGKALCFGDNITTDYLSPGRYKYFNLTMKEYASHMMEDIRPGFYDTICPGDILVAGKNFGCGSSRESAPAVIKEAGISCVLAKSFARIFYRNAISIGLLLIECDTSDIQDCTSIDVDVTSGTVTLENGLVINGKPLPENMLNAVLNGGMSQDFIKYHEFRL